MLPYRDSRLTKIAIGAFFVLAIVYGVFELRGFLYGPHISVTTEAATVQDPFVTITGSVQRISSLSMNGTEISVTEDGAFSEPYLLSQGENRIILDATDKYGRTDQIVVSITYLPPDGFAAQVPPSATTTPSATSTESTSTVPVAPTQ